MEWLAAHGTAALALGGIALVLFFRNTTLGKNILASITGKTQPVVKTDGTTQTEAESDFISKFIDEVSDNPIVKQLIEGRADIEKTIIFFVLMKATNWLSTSTHSESDKDKGREAANVFMSLLLSGPPVSNQPLQSSPPKNIL